MNRDQKPSILFEDDDIVVVAKPAGMYVHRSPGHEEGTLADALAATRPGMREAGGAERPGVVHRLDADTSGVMVFAKTRRAYLRLREAFGSHRAVKKTYLAVCHAEGAAGRGLAESGTLRTTIGRKAWDARRMAADVPDGAEAVTHWLVLGRRRGLAVVEFRIETGRTHQIRVHAAHLGCPIAGDALYGDAAKDARMRPRPKRTLLHAVELSFAHPVSGKPLTFAVPPPDDIIFAVP